MHQCKSQKDGSHGWTQYSYKARRIKSLYVVSHGIFISAHST